MTYPDRLRLNEHTGAASDGMGGRTGGSDATVIYDGRCDAQDDMIDFRVDAGLISREGGSRVFLPVPVDSRFKVAQTGTITYAGGDERAVVVAEVHRLDEHLVMRFS